MIEGNLVTGLAAFTVAGWTAAAIWVTWGMRRLPSLAQDGSEETATLPTVSIVAAARDEAGTLEDALSTVLALDYPGLEVIAVNDRSTDGMGALLHQLAADEPRLEVLHVSDLPEGWLGKNHALHLGAGRATGELILFTDADVHFESTALRRAVAIFQKRRLDHLAVYPKLTAPGFWARAFIGCFALAFTFYARPWRARLAQSKAHVGIGAFNLVRADAYRAIGGHERVRMRPDDDMRLGRELKAAGFRQDAALAGDLVQVTWYPDVASAVRGFEKNAFAAVNYSLVLAVGAGGALLAFWTGPWLALLLTAGFARLAFAASVVAMLGAWRANRSIRFGLGYALTLPITSSLLAYTIVRAAVITIRQGGIRWRGTLYPLQGLLQAKDSGRLR